MAILQALISLIARSAGKILNAAFGWAVLALFGRTSPKEQTLLSAVVAAAAAWPFLLAGVVFPKAMLFIAPSLKLVNLARGRMDVRLPALVQEGIGAEFMTALVAALSLHHVELRPGDPPWHMTAPANVLKKLGGRAFANFVGERPQYRVSAELEVNLNPNEVLLRGKERA